MHSVWILFCLSKALASVNSPGRDEDFGAPMSFPVAQQPADEPSSAADAGFESYISKTNGILIAHAVTGTLAWAFFSPMGAILLRLNINHPVILKLHIGIQIFSYALFVASSIMGIWVAIQTEEWIDIWAEPHIIIGLVILALATFQPIIGQIHHRIYSSRAKALAATHRGPRPGRTTWSRFHVWLGRSLITLGIINGGLGLQLMETSPAQDLSVTRDAEIGYGVSAGFIWCLYVTITSVWEGTRSRRRQEQPYQSSRTIRHEKLETISNNSTSPPPEPRIQP